MVSSYWRNGPVLNNALSGVDMALWDIKGKMAGMPLYELFGGKCREAAAIYRHAAGDTPQEVEESILAYMEQGLRYVRCQLGPYGGRNQTIVSPEKALRGAYYNPAAYVRDVPAMFDHIRSKVGFDVELLHDIHERLAPMDAIRLARKLDPYNLFFLEDPFAPEQNEWFETLRQQCSIPIAMGELFNHPGEWTPLIAKRLIDFIRVHVSNIGGITPARKLIALCDAFSVRTAWHGPGDVSPVGHAVNVHLDVSTPNFGIQEWYGGSEKLREVFPGYPEVRGGYVYPGTKPGIGVDIDEREAAKYPCDNTLPAWTLSRLPDGTSARP
jgi:mannonate dehydratase